MRIVSKHKHVARDCMRLKNLLLLCCIALRRKLLIFFNNTRNEHACTAALVLLVRLARVKHRVHRLCACKHCRLLLLLELLPCLFQLALCENNHVLLRALARGAAASGLLCGALWLRAAVPLARPFHEKSSQSVL